MSNSITLYEETCKLVQNNPPDNYLNKNFYLRIVTTTFYELLTTKTSPLISKFCADNRINFLAENFKIETLNPSLPSSSSFDMYCIFQGLAVAFSENLDTCESFCNDEAVNNYIFRRRVLRDELKKDLIELLKAIDGHMKKFQPVEKVVEKIVYVEKPAPPKVIDDKETVALLKNLDAIAENRKSDDEKIVDEIKKVQQAMQDELDTVQKSLKQIAEIREGLDYRSLKEPIYQLIQLYHKLYDNVKRHPAADTAKGYAKLIKSCNSFLTYVTQSLKMLGVELINETGGTFNPDKNKVADDEPVELDATVTKVNKIGFIYKGQVLEKAEVEVSTSLQNSNLSIQTLGGGKNLNENWN